MLGRFKKIFFKDEEVEKGENRKILFRARNIYCVIQENRRGVFITPLLVSNSQSTFVDLETNKCFHVEKEITKSGVLPKLTELPTKVQKTMEVEGKVIGLVPFCDLCEQICENNAKEDVPEFEMFKTCTDPKFALPAKDLFNVVDDLEKYIQPEQNQNDKVLK